MKKIVFAIVIIIAIILLIWWWQSQRSGVNLPAAGDTTEAINQQLESIDVGDLEAEFQAIDADLNNL